MEIKAEVNRGKTMKKFFSNLKFLRKTALLVSVFIFIVSTFISCGQSNTKYSFFSMDTIISLNLRGYESGKAAEEIEKETLRLENMLTRTADSPVSRFNRSDNGTPVTDEIAEIIGIAHDVYKLSSGKYDITIAPLVELWNITKAGDGWTPPDSEKISELLGLIDFSKISLENDFLSKSSKEISVDLGSIGKGYALGAAAEIADSEYKLTGTLSFGGNVAIVGNYPDGCKVGIRNPFNTDSIFCTLLINKGIIAVSGGYERYAEYEGERYHHILDPETGYPAVSDIACSVVWVKGLSASDGAFCDALSTALFILGSEKASELMSGDKFSDIGYLLILNDRTVISSENLTSKVTLIEKID